ncbi:hypothetical protein BGY98DRAFT_238154 [Russula aff. rugulosa BPL654]|nr:hypothetical protein BGY98DRAFT_238154 [Russula aff. rugulosa BPL654]
MSEVEIRFSPKQAGSIVPGRPKVVQKMTQYYAPRADIQHPFGEPLQDSNSVLLVFPSSHLDGSKNQVVIQDSLNELLELVPVVPKLHRMGVLLKELLHEWEGTRMMMMMGVSSRTLQSPSVFAPSLPNAASSDRTKAFPISRLATVLNPESL